VIVFDSSALITCCSFEVDGIPVIQHILDVCHITLTGAVSDEVTFDYVKYPDAALAKHLIDEGAVDLQEIVLPADNILERYKLGKGEKESIGLAVERDFPLVTDDRLAFVVAGRMGIDQMLFLDLVVRLVEEKRLERDLAGKIVPAIASRYASGFVEHTLTILERRSRRCLT